MTRVRSLGAACCSQSRRRHSTRAARGFELNRRIRRRGSRLAPGRSPLVVCDSPTNIRSDFASQKARLMLAVVTSESCRNRGPGPPNLNFSPSWSGALICGLVAASTGIQVKYPGSLILGERHAATTKLPDRKVRPERRKEILSTEFGIAWSRPHFPTCARDTALDLDIVSKPQVRDCRIVLRRETQPTRGFRLGYGRELQIRGVVYERKGDPRWRS
jgi:hypothetical protein